MPRGRPKGSKNGTRTKIVKDGDSESSPPKDYVDGYRGKELVKENLPEYDVLCIVREAMRAEHSRFDWLKFLVEYRNTADYSEKKKLIHKYAPSVQCA